MTRFAVRNIVAQHLFFSALLLCRFDALGMFGTLFRRECGGIEK